MKNYIYQDYSMQDRVKMLQNTSVKSEVKTYNRSLSQSEVELEKDKYSSDAIELARQKAELKATAERLKGGITSIENLMEERLERIKTGQAEITGTLYGVPDYSKHRMFFYDGYGENISERELTPDEKQGRLFIGDDPLGKARPVPDGDGGVTDIEFEEVQPGNEEELKTAVDKMYEEEKPTIEPEAGNVEIPVQAPVEDKPAKKTKAPKKPKKSDDDDNSPL